MKKKIIFGVIAAGLTGYILLAMDVYQVPAYISNAEIIGTVNAAADSIEQQYVFPQTGKKIAEELRNNLRNGNLNVFTPPELERKMNAILLQASHDKHLHFQFSEHYANDLREGDKKTDSVFFIQEKQHDFYFFPVRQLPGNIGYLRMDRMVEPSHAADKLVRVFDSLKNAKGLILDFRNNHGGDPAMVQQIISRLYAPGQKVHLSDIYSRRTGDTTQFWSIPDVTGVHFPEVPVFILISKTTFSAAEELAYDLQSLHRAMIVGEGSGGGANPGDMIPIGRRFVMFLPYCKAINPYTKTNWENTGVHPDVLTSASKALDVALQLAQRSHHPG